MFERECELFVDSDDQPTTITPVVLRIIYDDDVYGARIVAERTSKDTEAEDGEDWTVCNHLVAIQTQFSSETDSSAKWSALDFSIDPPSYRSFEAHFKTEQDARDFKVRWKLLMKIVSPRKELYNFELTTSPYLFQVCTKYAHNLFSGFLLRGERLSRAVRDLGAARECQSRGILLRRGKRF